MEKILVLNFGGQYDQLIARRVREQHVYAEIICYDRIGVREIREAGYKGIIFTGGPYSVYEKDAPHFDGRILDTGIPVLGICYGAQLAAHLAGGTVVRAKEQAEYGKTVLHSLREGLFGNIAADSICWMSHTDRVERLPEGYSVTAFTDQCPYAAFENKEKQIYGVQFHPEVTHTECGTLIFRNFLFGVCGCAGDWTMEDFAGRAIEKYRRELAGKKVLLGLSGGVDSSVAAALLFKAIGKDLTCVFVDHGLLRKGEGDLVEKIFGEKMGDSFVRVNAGELFLAKLKGVTEPEEKRKIIGEEFIRAFEQEARARQDVRVLAQGTIYPDVIESGKGDAAVIKSHHNVGGLPEEMLFDEIVEPLRELFKDEVRNVGQVLGLPGELVFRQPFPGPGLAVRVTGEITAEKLEILREADAVFTGELESAAGIKRPDQYFAVLTDTRSVGVMGDFRTYGYTVALRAVDTDDFMTASFSRLPYEILERAAGRIVNEVKGVSRVVYDITSKPPATVEWL